MLGVGNTQIDTCMCDSYLSNSCFSDPQNVQTHESLIEAELASVKGDSHLAKKNYEVAILLAGRWGHLNDQALSYERHADHCFRLGCNEEAAYNYKRALELYREWGCDAKVELLESEHSDLVNPVTEVVLGNIEDVSRVSPPCPKTLAVKNIENQSSASPLSR